jgi:hypothetical protein
VVITYDALSGYFDPRDGPGLEISILNGVRVLLMLKFGELLLIA